MGGWGACRRRCCACARAFVRVRSCPLIPLIRPLGTNWRGTRSRSPQIPPLMTALPQPDNNKQPPPPPRLASPSPPSVTPPPCFSHSISAAETWESRRLGLQEERGMRKSEKGGKKGEGRTRAGCEVSGVGDGCRSRSSSSGSSSRGCDARRKKREGNRIRSGGSGRGGVREGGMRECAGRRDAESDDGRPVLINSQFFHPRHSAPRRSGEGGGRVVTPPQHTAAYTSPPPPHILLLPHLPLHLTFLPAQQLLLQFELIAHRWRLCLAGKRPLGRFPHTNAHSIEKKGKKKKKKEKGDGGGGS